MLEITHMPETCTGDTLGARCDRVNFEYRFGFLAHTNCQDTLAEAIREYGLTPDDTHDSFNLFMNTTWDSQGNWWSTWSTGRKDDYVDLLACMDTLCAPVVCGSGDIALVSNFSVRPISISIFEATESSRARIRAVKARFASRARQVVDDFRAKDIRAERELVADPGYEPDYLRYPLRVAELLVPLSAGARAKLRTMVQQGLGTSLEDALRRCFMLWSIRNQARRHFSDKVQASLLRAVATSQEAPSSEADGG
jgi:hypothetical protein